MNLHHTMGRVLMMGTEGTGRFQAVNTPMANIGYRDAGGGSFRIRIEKFARGIVSNELLAAFTRITGWKQPGDNHENRFSAMAYSNTELQAKLIVALEVLLQNVTQVEYIAGDDVPGFGSGMPPVLKELVDGIVAKKQAVGDMSPTPACLENGHVPTTGETSTNTAGLPFGDGKDLDTQLCNDAHASGQTGDQVPRGNFAYDGYQDVDARALKDTVRTCGTEGDTTEPGARQPKIAAQLLDSEEVATAPRKPKKGKPTVSGRTCATPVPPETPEQERERLTKFLRTNGAKGINSRWKIETLREKAAALSDELAQADVE